MDRAKVLTFDQGNKVLGVSRSAAYARIKEEGDFPRPFRIGGKLAYLEDDLHAWLRRKYAEAQLAPWDPQPRNRGRKA
jgi:predicted DNA-binding transcriptional regulator AlpA